MRHGFIAGVFAVCMALGIGASPVAHAQSNELPTCDENALWSVAETVQVDEFGALRLTYLCTPNGWLLIGASYCTTSGNCSSD